MTTRQKKKPETCANCGSHLLKARRTNYPMTIGEKTIIIERLSLKECTVCHHQHPSKAGKEKIERCMMRMTMLMLFDQ